MSLPPVYKYLDVPGAKLTLRSGTFKHAKPSDFNDIEDLTIQSIFPEETEAALQKLSAGFTDVILQHLNEQPTCASPMREKVALMQSVYRNNPNAAAVVKAEVLKLEEPIHDVEAMRQLARATISDINEFMQGYRVLCVSLLKDSDEMWSSYAEGNKGIALRIVPNVVKDSKFQLFRPVEYRESRPPLYDDTVDFIAGSLFGDQEARRKEMLDKIIYSKTLRWQHEAEYRLAIPLSNGETPWNTLRFHPDEITELYLGREMTAEDQQEIVGLAFALNPEIAVFEVGRDANSRMTFERI